MIAMGSEWRRRSFPRAPGVALAGLLVIALVPGLAAALEISLVSAEPPSFDPARHEKTRIRFTLSEPARVTLHVYDAREREVRRIESQGILPQGPQNLEWDGADLRGRPVPAEAYAYTLTATGSAGTPVEWDLTDSTGGDNLRVDDVEWDPEHHQIQYTLPQRARVRVRVGLKDGGPMLATVIDWVPRKAGRQTAPWNGKDTSGVLDLAHHPELALAVEAFALPQNSLLVGPPPSRVQYSEQLGEAVPRRAVHHPKSARLQDYGHLPADSRGDFPAKIVLPSDLRRDAEKRPIVASAIPVQVALRPEHVRRLTEQRFEATFYLDGRVAFDIEVAFFPITWRWDPAGLNPGLHYLTVNVRGFEGQFGSATTPVIIEAARPPVAPTAGAASP